MLFKTTHHMIKCPENQIAWFNENVESKQTEMLKGFSLKLFIKQITGLAKYDPGEFYNKVQDCLKNTSCKKRKTGYQKLINKLIALKDESLYEEYYELHSNIRDVLLQMELIISAYNEYYMDAQFNSLIKELNEMWESRVQQN